MDLIKSRTSQYLDSTISSPRIRELSRAGFSLKEMITNHGRRLLWGRGFSLVGKDRKVIQKIFEQMRVETFFGEYFNLLSNEGHCIITIDRTLTGELVLNIPLLSGMSNVALVRKTEELAVIWQKFIYDHSNYYMRTTYDREKTINEFFHDAGGGTPSTTQILGESRKIANYLRVKQIDYHNFGFVPVLFCPNLPHANFSLDSVGFWYPDDVPSGDGLQSLQEEIVQILGAIDWELNYNITRIFAMLTPAEEQQMRKDPEWALNRVNRMVVSNSAMGINKIIQESGRSPLTVLQGDPKLESLTHYLDYTIDRAYNLRGYNSPQGTREHGTNKTSGEISLNMQNDLLTTNEKRLIQTAQINRLIQMLGKAMGKEEIDCKIVIHGMSTTEITKLTDSTILQVQNGLLDRKSAVMKLNSCSEDEADLILERVDKEQKLQDDSEIQVNKNNNQPKGGK